MSADGVGVPASAEPETDTTPALWLLQVYEDDDLLAFLGKSLCPAGSKYLGPR